MSESRKARFTDREVPIPRSSLERRGFLRGIARLVEFGRVFEGRARAPELPDYQSALAGDWQRIGGDLRKAVHQAAVETGVSESEAARHAETDLVEA